MSDSAASLQVDAAGRWPTSAEYDAALQRPSEAFADPVLGAATFEAGPFGLSSVEGQSAVVFFAETSRGPVVVRCFKRLPAFGAQRYNALAEALQARPVPALACATWHDDGVEVNGRRWPYVQMESVSGLSLAQWIEAHLTDAGGLRDLADRWLRLMTELSEARIAHGDLQQDNVRVTAGGEGPVIRLIDLDAVWIDATAGMPPAERGHRHFQHPQRLATGFWDRRVDTFSALVIYVSLRAIAADPGLWTHHNGENLIFSDVDFRQPAATPVWLRLAASPDLEVRKLTHLLDLCCRRSVQVDTDLRALLETRTLPDGSSVWSTPTAERQGRVEWWQDGSSAPQAPAEARDWWPPDPPDAASPIARAEADEAATVGRPATTAAPPALDNDRAPRHWRQRLGIALAIIAVVVLVALMVWSMSA